MHLGLIGCTLPCLGIKLGFTCGLSSNIPGRFPGFYKAFVCIGTSLFHGSQHLIDTIDHGTANHICNTAAGCRTCFRCIFSGSGYKPDLIERYIQKMACKLRKHGVITFTRICSSSIDSDTIILVKLNNRYSHIARHSDSE